MEFLSLPMEEIRSQFLKCYDPQNSDTTPYQRFEAAVNREASDRTPFDFWAVDEIQERLMTYFQVSSMEEVLQILGIDARIVTPEYIGPALETCPDGSFFTVYGSHRKSVSNEFSTYEEYASYPLAEVQSVQEIETWFRWPKSEYWDWAGLPAQIDALNAKTRYHIRYDVGGIFETAWGLYGMDNFMMALFDKPEIPCAIMDCITDIFIQNVHNLMRVAQGKIDIVYTYDDIAMQNGLLISPKMWKQFILPRHQRLNAVIKQYDLNILYHSCGAVYPMINNLIELMHIDVLNPLQPLAAGMDMQRIKDEFGSRVAFHGGIDLQKTMSSGTPADVTAEVADRLNTIGRGGGYICTTAHYIQADTPLNNILALYLAPRNAPN